MRARLPESRWPYIVAAIAMIAGFFFSLIGPAGDPRPEGDADDIAALAERSDLNLLFILIDTLRADRLTSYGYARETSPNMDRLAASGVRFARNMAQSSWTKASMASLWTALYPARTGVLRYMHAMAPEARMPAEILGEAGFRTVALWRNGWVAPNFGFSQGFDAYTNPQPGPVPAELRRETPWGKIEGTDVDLVAGAEEFLRAMGHERWFLYLHLMDVHQYVSDPESARFGTRYSDIYDNAVHWVDRLVGTLVASLERRGLREHTLIALASDHGEAFGEHGSEGHARNLYTEVTETPLILSFPFRLEPGIVVEAPTQNIDLWPTLFALLGLPSMDDVDGRSLLPEIRSAARGEAADRDASPRFAQIDRFWGRTQEDGRPVVSITEGTFRLIHYVTSPEDDELYDHRDDPGEQRDVAGDQPERVTRLRTRVENHLERAAAPWGGGAPEVEIEDMLLRQLRALGYDVE
jgi:arylsulfatase A-like enzyme